MKEKNQKVEECEKRVIELMKKIGEETNNRSKAEAEVIRANKMIDYLHEILENKKGSKEISKPTTAANNERNQGRPRCLDQDRSEGCKFGDTCRFIHDEGRMEIKVAKSEDCTFWLEGACRFADKSCRNIHDPKKRGSKPRQEVRRSIGVANTSFLGQDNLLNQQTVGHTSAVPGLQLVSSGGQLYLHQGGQVVQQVQTGSGGLQQAVLGLQSIQPGLQNVQMGMQGMQSGLQGGQMNMQGGQFNPQQGGLGAWGQ